MCILSSCYFLTICLYLYLHYNRTAAKQMSGLSAMAFNLNASAGRGEDNNSDLLFINFQHLKEHTLNFIQEATGNMNYSICK